MKKIVYRVAVNIGYWECEGGGWKEKVDNQYPLFK